MKTELRFAVGAPATDIFELLACPLNYLCAGIDDLPAVYSTYIRYKGPQRLYLGAKFGVGPRWFPWERERVVEFVEGKRLAWRGPGLLFPLVTRFVLEPDDDETIVEVSVEWTSGFGPPQVRKRPYQYQSSMIALLNS